MSIPLRSGPTPFRHRVALPIVVGLTLVVSGIVDSRSTGAVMAQAPDPCALLMTDEIQPLAVKEQVGNGVPSAIRPEGRAACRYRWGAGTGRYTLDVIVDDASRTPDAIKQNLVTAGGAGTVSEVIAGIGEVAAFKSDSYLLASATAYMKGRVLQLNLDGYDARAKKDQLVALLKAGASRL